MCAWENLSVPSASKREEKEFFSARFCSRRKKKRVGFSPSSNHLARDRILTPSQVLLIREVSLVSRSLTVSTKRLSPEKN